MLALRPYQIGTARSFGALSSGEYGVFAKSNDNLSSITMQFQIVE